MSIKLFSWQWVVVSCSLGAALNLMPSSALAADSAAAAAASVEQGDKLEEVMVTARRREENLQAVPIAITVLSQDTLEDNNVRTFQDMQLLVPSMTVSTGNLGGRDQANITIRGQGWGGLSGSPAVAVYLNEVPIPADGSGVLAGGPGLLFDLESVQVLKGPQGTLFGRNTQGGAILLQTARPKKELGGHVQVGFGNYNDREIDAAVDLPLVGDVLLARVAFNGQERDGFTHVLSLPDRPNGTDFDNRNYYAVRGTLTFRPTEAFQNDTIMTYQRYRSHGWSNFIYGVDPTKPAALTYPTFPAILAQQQALGPRTLVPLDEPASTLSHTGGTLFELENISRVAITNHLTLRNIFGYHKINLNQLADYDGTSLPIFDINVLEYPYEQLTEELQLLGENLGGRFNWQVGAFYLDSRPEGYDPYPRTDLSFIGSDSDSRALTKIRSKAVYAQGTYDLSALIPHVKLTLGARYTRDDRLDTILGASPTDPTNPFCGTPSVNCSYPTDTPSKSSAPTWTAGLDYQATPDTLLYLSSRRGYRGGGALQTGPLPSGAFISVPFGSEYVRDIELGTKSDWHLGGALLRTNADVYYQDYTNIQVSGNQQFPGVVGGLPVTLNAGTARLWGAELEALAQLTHDLQVGVVFDYLSFQYTHFGSNVSSPGTIVAGETANRVPRKYGMNGRYRLPLDSSIGEVSVRANWNWQDKSGDFLGTSEIPAYSLLNLAVNWDGIAGKPFDASLFVSNATDRVYQAGGIKFLHFGYATRIYGDPRFFGIRLGYRF